MTHEEYVKHVNSLIEYGRKELDGLSALLNENEADFSSPEAKHRWAKRFAQAILSNIHCEIHDLERSAVE